MGVHALSDGFGPRLVSSSHPYGHFILKLLSCLITLTSATVSWKPQAPTIFHCRPASSLPKGANPYTLTAAMRVPVSLQVRCGEAQCQKGVEGDHACGCVSVCNQKVYPSVPSVLQICLFHPLLRSFLRLYPCAIALSARQSFIDRAFSQAFAA